MTYSTKQKDLIINYIKKTGKEFTINELYEELNKEVGLTTIYRCIDKLDKNKQLNKHIGTNNTTYYQYLEKCNNKNHFYLKCEKCGCLKHIDCKCIEELSRHIVEEHKFTLNKEQIIINGICEKCSK